MRRTLVGLHYSPWTEKARWALDHHAHGYRYDEFTPMVGEPFLRMRAKRFSGRISVPILFEENAIIDDSFDIARYADRLGRHGRLFPEGQMDAIRRWNELSERMLAAGRSLSLARVVESEEAQMEGLPPFVPDSLRPLAAPVAKFAAGYIAKKYGSADVRDRAEATLDQGLGELTKALGGKPHLLEGFSYADVVMAVGLQLVSPVGDAHLRLGPGTRACCEVESMKKKHAAAFAWRDSIYAEHRRSS